MKSLYLRSLLKRAVFTIAFCVSLSLFFQPCYGKVILDKDAYNAILAKIADVLDTKGIHVVQSWSSVVVTRGNPVLAPLQNYKVSSLQPSRWLQDLQAKVIDGLFAAPGLGTATTFRQKWDANQDETIFISFAREDYAHAVNVKNALEQEGYSVFTYLGEQQEPVLQTDQIAYYLKTAANHFVLDTKTARLKEGVMAEALVYAKYCSPEALLQIPALEEKFKKLLTNTAVPMPSYADLEGRFKKYYDRPSLSNEAVNKLMNEDYGLSRKNINDYTAKLVSQQQKALMADMAEFKAKPAPVYLNWLIEILAEIFEGSLFICPRCHMPYTFPVCLPL